MADTLLLRLTIAPTSDGTLLESHEAHPVLAAWVAGWPELEAYPGKFSPLLFLYEPFANASFSMPITLDMITLPPEGPPPGATLDDFLYLQASMFPGFDPLGPEYYGIEESGGGASYFASLPTWTFANEPRIERPTVREIRIYSVGGGPAPAFWTDLIGTTETL